MAYRIANKRPIDTKARVAVGVSVPFSAPGVFYSTYTTADQLKSNIFNYFNTSPGERYMNPTFGSSIKQTIFEAVDTQTFDFLKQQIQDDMAKYFPEVTVINVDVYGTEDSNTIYVVLSYASQLFGINDSLNLAINV